MSDKPNAEDKLDPDWQPTDNAMKPRSPRQANSSSGPASLMPWILRAIYRASTAPAFFASRPSRFCKFAMLSTVSNCVECGEGSFHAVSGVARPSSRGNGTPCVQSPLRDAPCALSLPSGGRRHGVTHAQRIWGNNWAHPTSPNNRRYG